MEDNLARVGSSESSGARGLNPIPLLVGGFVLLLMGFAVLIGTNKSVPEYIVGAVILFSFAAAAYKGK